MLSKENQECYVKSSLESFVTPLLLAALTSCPWNWLIGSLPQGTYQTQAALSDKIPFDRQIEFIECGKICQILTIKILSDNVFMLDQCISNCLMV